MASVRKASYYSMKVPQRPGSGAQLLAALKAAKVNLLAFTGFPEGGGAQVDFVPQDSAKFLKAARAAKQSAPISSSRAKPSARSSL